MTNDPLAEATTPHHDLSDVPDPSDEDLRSLAADLDDTEASPAPGSTQHALVVVVEDRHVDETRSGDLAAELIHEQGFTVDAIVTVGPRKSAIRKALQTAVVGGADLVVTVGGTGYGQRDKAPEATKHELDVKVPAIAAAVRNSGLTAHILEAGLSRGTSGISGSTVIVNLAGSRPAIRDGVRVLGPLVKHVLCDISDGLRR